MGRARLDDSLADPPGNIPVFLERAVKLPSIMLLPRCVAEMGRLVLDGIFILVERAAETGLRVTFLDFDVESRKVERGVPTLADVRDIRGVTFPLGVR